VLEARQDCVPTLPLLLILGRRLMCKNIPPCRNGVLTCEQVVRSVQLMRTSRIRPDRQKIARVSAYFLSTGGVGPARDCLRSSRNARGPFHRQELRQPFLQFDHNQYIFEPRYRMLRTVDLAIASLWMDFCLLVSTSSSEHRTLVPPPSFVETYAFKLPSSSPVINRGIFPDGCRHERLFMHT